MKNYKHLTDYLKKIGISLEEFNKMRDVTKEAYFNIERLGLYGETYTKLQNIEGIMYRMSEDEYIEEDELDDVMCFYENNYK